MELYKVSITDKKQKCVHKLRFTAKNQSGASKQAIAYLKKHIDKNAEYEVKGCGLAYAKHRYFGEAT